MNLKIISEWLFKLREVCESPDLEFYHTPNKCLVIRVNFYNNSEDCFSLRKVVSQTELSSIDTEVFQKAVLDFFIESIRSTLSTKSSN